MGSSVTITPDTASNVTITPDSGGGEQQPSLWDRVTAPYNPGDESHNALVRFLSSAGGAMLSVPGQIYHAIKDEPTPEEAEEFKGHWRIPGELAAERLTSAPLVRGVEQWTNPETRPTFGGAMSVLPEALGTGVGTTVGGEKVAGAVGKVLGKVAQVPSDIAAIRSVAKDTPGTPFRVGLQAITHDLLNKAADKGKQQLWDAHARVSARVGGLKADIANADYQAGEPAIPAADLIPKIDELSARYKAAGTPLPKFDAAVNSIANRANPYLTFEEAADLRSEVGSLSARAAKGTRDAGAIGELEQTLKRKLADRADELDMSKKFNDYNGLWRTLKEYEGQGPMGKLLNAPTGYDFFNALRDPSSMSQLRRTVDSLSDFGLPNDFTQKLLADHKVLHDYAKSAGGPIGFTGRLKALMQHPVTAGLGGTISRAAFGWSGGIIGTVGAADIANAIGAARSIRELGGPPSTVGEMKQYTSQPTGAEVVRPERGAPQIQANIISALKNSGFDAQTAKAKAVAAIKANPKGDFDTLVRDAYGRRVP